MDGIYRKLEKELADKKNKMAAIIDISNASYEARDKAQAEMVALKQQADKEQEKLLMEWNQLGQLIEKDRKLKDFMKNKEHESSSTGADPALEEELTLKKKVTKGAWGIAKDRADIHLSMEKVQSYEEAFAKIQKATNITDIDELVQTFINAEDHNFSLFNYVNDLSHEMEKLETKISKTQAELEKYGGKGGTKDGNRKKILADLEEKHAANEAQAAMYEDRSKEAARTIDSLKSGSHSC